MQKISWGGSDDRIQPGILWHGGGVMGHLSTSHPDLVRHDVQRGHPIWVWDPGLEYHPTNFESMIDPGAFRYAPVKIQNERR